MKLSKKKLRNIIATKIKLILKEERDRAAVLNYYRELREKPDISADEKKAIRSKYNIASITTTEKGEKRVVFKTDPIDVLVPAGEKEG